MNDFLFYLAAFVLVLGVLIVVHEFGHYLVARIAGVKVLRFSVGFGRALWSRRVGRDRTEFSIGAFPIGGYVKMLDEREGEVPAELLSQAFTRKPVGQRIAIVAAGPLANFILAFAFFWVLAMLGSQQIKPVIGAVASGSLAASAGLEAGQEVVAVDGERTSGWGAVNLQLVRRLGETGTVELLVREAGSSVETPRQLQLP